MSRLIAFLLLSLICSSKAIAKDEVAAIRFSYNISADSNTSAGVFAESGVLIRTLWSSRPEHAGMHESTWDGRDDTGKFVKGTVFQIKVLESQVAYHWDGPIGNTGNSWTSDNNNWSQFGTPPTQKLCFVNGSGWIVSGYAEGQYNLGRLDPSNPNSPHILNSNYLNTQIGLSDVATDDVHLYFMNAAQETWVTIFDAKTGSPASFTRGESIVGSRGQSVPNQGFNNTTLSVTDRGRTGVGVPTGIAVQKVGHLLAVAHGDFMYHTHQKGLDLIRLFDKSSGRPIGTDITILDPQQLAFSSAGLWVISNHTLNLVTEPGSKNIITQPIKGLSNPVSVAVNRSNEHVYVLDGGSSQQLKEYDTKFNLVRAYGDRGGYNDLKPDITNHRLLLDNTAILGRPSLNGSWVTVENTGDVWFSDAGTAQRVIHLKPDGGDFKYVDQILYTPPTYYAAVDHGDPTRVFSGMFEYRVNYHVPIQPGDPDPLLGGNGAWRLVRNWSIGNRPPPGANARDYFLTVEDLGNGRTYAQINAYQNNYGYMAELPKIGPLRYTGQVSIFQSPVLERDGSLMAIKTSGSLPNITQTITRRSLIGFDSSQDPRWSNAVSVSEVRVDAEHEPYTVKGIGMTPNPYPSDNGVYPIYNASPTQKIGYPHLGGLSASAHSYIFKTNREECISARDEKGVFPCKPGYGGHSGIAAIAEGHHILVAYDGQYAPWGNTYSDYYEDGLLIGEFTQAGPSGHRQPGVAPPRYPVGFAANVLTVSAVTVGSDIYVYIPTESGFPPIVRWRLGNLSSLHEYGATGPQGARLTLTKLF